MLTSILINEKKNLKSRKPENIKTTNYYYQKY